MAKFLEGRKKIMADFSHKAKKHTAEKKLKKPTDVLSAPITFLH